MLLVIHNLPYHIKYAEIRLLLQEKCGLNQVILDNLMNEGSLKKVTVGLADDGDAAILVRKINGLYLEGAQLYVEDVRLKKESEQPYRCSKPLIQEENDSFRYEGGQGFQEIMPQRGGNPGFQAPLMQRGFQGYQEPQPLIDANQMYQPGINNADPIALMNYNMAMNNMVFVPTMPLAQNPLGYGAQQQQVLPLIPHRPEGANGLNFNRDEPQGNRSLWDDSSMGHDMNRPGNRDRRDIRRSLSPSRGQPQAKSSRWETQNNLSQWDQRPEFQTFDNPPYRQRTNERDHPNGPPRHGDPSGDRRRRPDRNPRPFDRFESSSADPSSRNAGPNWELQRNARNLRESLPANNWMNESMESPKRFGNRYENEPAAKRPAPSRFSGGNFGASSKQSMPNRNVPSYRDDPITSSLNREPWHGSSRNRNSASSGVWQERKSFDPASAGAPTQQQWPQQKRVPKWEPNPYFAPKPKEPTFSTDFKARAEATPGPTEEVTVQQQLNRNETWRGQATSAIVKEMLKNQGMRLRMTDPLVIQLKHSVRSRINVLLGDKINVQPGEIQTIYRSKFPANGDRKLVKTVSDSLAKSLHQSETAKDKAESTDATPTPPKTPKPAVSRATKDAGVFKEDLTPYELANKIMSAKTSNRTLIPGARKTLPNHAGDDKQYLAATKRLEKMEMSEGADIYPLPAPEKKALDKSADTLCDLFMGECLEPTYEHEKVICEQISDVAADEFRKVVRLQITKRLLNITTGLTVLIYVTGKPNIQALEHFLKPYGVISLKKSVSATSKTFVATCDDFQNYDALCAVGSKELGNCKINIKPRIPTGQKAPRRGPQMLKRNMTTMDRSDESLLQPQDGDQKVAQVNDTEFTEDVQINESTEQINTIDDDVNGDNEQNDEGNPEQVDQNENDTTGEFEDDEIGEDGTEEYDFEVIVDVTKEYDEIDENDVNEDDLEDY